MKLEPNDKLSLFSSIDLPEVFFTEYLPSTNGNYIKVYLCMLFYSKYSKDVKINDLSKKLNLPFNVIQEAVKYWEDLGVITKKNTGYLMNSMQEIELYKLYKPKLSLSPEAIEKNSKEQYRAKAIESINNSFFQGLMSASWYLNIELWFKKYEFDEQVMTALFQYCYNKSALHRNYVQTVADAWHKNNVKTFNDLDNYYIKQEKFNKLKNTISKKLGLQRNLTQYEEAYIEKWVVDYGYDLSVIEIALKRTTAKVNPNFDYLNKLISDWNDRNLKTAADVQAFLEEFKKKGKQVKELEKKTGYSNSNARNYTNLDELYTDATQAQ